jgi:MOSC domain-containing protein YiiM
MSSTSLPLAQLGQVRAVFAGPIRTLRSPRHPGGITTSWKSAILKSRVPDHVHVGTLGLHGDNQKEKKHHGGPTKAVLLYAAAHYDRWALSLQPHAIAHAADLREMSADIDASQYNFGAFGENLTIDGLTEQTVCLGDTWQVGECVLQITEPRGPCATLTRRWMRPELLGEVKATAAAGWYNAVRVEGAVREGDRVTLVERIQTEWTLDRVFHLIEDRVVARADIERLRDATCTNDGLRAHLNRRLLTPSRITD